MPTPLVLPVTFLEATTGIYSFPLVDERGTSIAAGEVETLTLTLADLDSNELLNGRDKQDILNTNDGTITTAGSPPVTTVTLQLQPEDTVILNQHRLVEYRVLVFTWTWDLGRHTATHAVQCAVENVPHVP